MLKRKLGMPIYLHLQLDFCEFVQIYGCTAISRKKRLEAAILEKKLIKKKVAFLDAQQSVIT